ncbi:MAG: zinc ABC transporter substrate-binding protein [Armatimonadota bacterium]|nr:zinc ABC transporter substrate-binding protein [Armatimonadota bacterium]MDR7466698.1 zinc ABC transporter substrate-binding protein [Armatimonadota bacterium]MDR7492828.1 zinc ABC transporter substrate-binding protein [Armatimonadota bacterium]MDR7498604.1 zinc ABC transporter substrate-binding protein [Armatimonadota bacterium]MDR7504568.1 zinc ABC transporter substrate-binding protein [Armatimonadota bacterium]
MVGLVAAGCAPRQAAPSGRVAVAATIYPVAEFARRVGGERVEVREIVPPGVEPHDYEPAPQDLVTLHRSRVFVYNGAGFEPWVGRTLPGLPPSVVAVDGSAGLPLRRGDPHLWLDPVLAQAQAERLRDGLIRADPDGRAHYERGARKLIADLAALDRRYAQTLGRCARREFVTAHDAFGYLAARYGLQQVPVTGIDPEAEPTPARLRQIIATIRRTGATAVFTESFLNPRVAETLARETGVRVLVLDPLEGLSAEDRARGRNYFTVMDENLTHLADGLDCGR